MSSATPTKSEELERIPRHDPKATPERVADSIVRYVEKALTEAYLSVTPPSPAAPVSAKLQALRLKRLPISRRNQTRKRMETHDKLLGDLYRMHYSLDGHAVSGSDITPTRSPSTNSFIPSWPIQDGVPYQTWPSTIPTVDSLETRPAGLKLPYSSPASSPKTTRVLSFEYDDKWSTRLRDAGFDELAKALEQSAREFAEKSQTFWGFTLVEESDPEIPSWKRNVLRISIDTLDFDEKIRLWDEIDKQIRERLAMAANDYPDLRQDVKQFSESLFLKIDL